MCGEIAFLEQLDGNPPHCSGRTNNGKCVKHALFLLVSFVDSSGLGALISGMKATRIAGGDLRIAQVGDQARLILELTTLDKVMKIYPTVEEALGDN